VHVIPGLKEDKERRQLWGRTAHKKVYNQGGEKLPIAIKQSRVRMGSFDSINQTATFSKVDFCRLHFYIRDAPLSRVRVAEVNVRSKRITHVEDLRLIQAIRNVFVSCVDN
jgi:hypothetical protein